MMTKHKLPATLADVLEEVWRAIELYPDWPTDPLHALAILGEEYGELNKAVLQASYEPSKANADDVRTEAIQTAAMALRFILNLGHYEYLKAKQYSNADGDGDV